MNRRLKIDDTKRRLSVLKPQSRRRRPLEDKLKWLMVYQLRAESRPVKKAA